jgi:C1A family cysteine protease
MQKSLAVVSFSTALAGMPDCSSSGCESMCSCVESTCANLYDGCVADTQCNDLLTCMLGCSCGDLFCALGCVAGKTLDSVSSQVKTCGSGCASSADEQWEAYKTEFKKTYASADEEAERRGIFDESNKRIADLNEKNGKVAFTWTRQSDRKEEEKHYRGAVRPTETNRKSAPVKAATIASVPSAINWAETIAVTPIKNQGQCGSCWAFSATETIESEYVLTAAISVDDVVSLSPQQITSCTTDRDGCGGGWPSSGYEYAEGGCVSANPLIRCC